MNGFILLYVFIYCFNVGLILFVWTFNMKVHIHPEVEN